MVVNARMEVSMVNILVGMWMMSCFAAVTHIGSYVPAMFVFGDSLADAGSNNYIPHCTARANFTPYGVSFLPYPTARFNNGHTDFDFLATKLGLPFTPPYLKPKVTGLDRSVIILPVFVLEQFHDALGQFVDITRSQGLTGESLPNVHTVASAKRRSES